MMKKQQMDDEDKKEKELRKIDKAKKEGVDKVDEKNDEVPLRTFPNERKPNRQWDNELIYHRFTVLVEPR